MSKPPKVVIPGLNRGAGIPPGYTLGRRRGTGKGPAELLDLAQMKGAGLATTAQVTQAIDHLSTALSTTTAAQAGAALMMGGEGEDGAPGPPGQPGTAGTAGSPGAAGPAGPPGFALDGQDGEEGMPIPGASGAPGAAGAPGPQGPIGLGLDGQDGEEGIPIPGLPGSAGSIGATGPQGPIGFGIDGLDGEEGMSFPGAPVSASVLGPSWTPYTPTLTPVSGVLTSYITSGAYRVVGDIVFVHAAAVIADKGTATGSCDISMPFPLSATDTVFNFNGRTNDGNKTLNAFMQSGIAALARTNLYDGTTPFTATAVNLLLSGFYRTDSAYVPLVTGVTGGGGTAGAPGATGGTGPQGPMGFGVDGQDGEEGMPIPGAPGANGTNGAGGLTAPTLRSSSVTAVTAANTITVALPAGTAAGDVLVLAATQDNAINLPTGFTQFNSLGPTQINGLLAAKIMTSGDISTGTVTVTFIGSGNGAVCLASVTGSTIQGVRGFNGFQSSSGVSSVAVKSTYQPAQTDLILGIAGNRGTSNNTFSNFTSLGTINAASSVFFGNFTGSCKLGLAETASFSTAGLGYYVAFISLRG